MNIKGIIKKELKDGARNYRFLIVFAAFIFFAIMDPVMTKFILPQVLKSMYPDMSPEMLSPMMNSTQIGTIRAYLGDIFEIGTLILAFTFSGIIAQEISERTLILPVCTGKRYGELITAKLLVNGLILMVAAAAAAMIDYFYSGIFFGFDLPSPLPALRAGLLQGLFMVFVLAMLMLIGSLVKKPLATGLITLIPVYLLSYIGDLLKINQYLPSGLLSEGQQLAVIPSTAMLESILCTLAIVILAAGFTVIRLSKMELMKG